VWSGYGESSAIATFAPLRRCLRVAAAAAEPTMTRLSRESTTRNRNCSNTSAAWFAICGAGFVFARSAASGRLAPVDHDEITNKRIRRIAKDHGCTVADVNAALDRHPIELDRDLFLKRTLAMELVELDELQQAFREKALRDCDVPSGILLIKVAERRATLLGLNPNLGHAVAIVQHAPEHRETSTDRIERAIARLIEDQRREANGSGEPH
jgi:hypothetical protein